MIWDMDGRFSKEVKFEHRPKGRVGVDPRETWRKAFRQRDLQVHRS